jgi:putative oxidoreductase
MKRKFLAGITPALLVLLFAYTGANKLFGLTDFTASMYNQPIPHPLAYILARVIPIAEILTAACLLSSKTQKLGLYTSFSLLTIFTIYIGLILLHVFRKIPCSCAGIFRHVTWQQHLWINLLLLALTGLSLSPHVKKHFQSPLNHSI